MIESEATKLIDSLETFIVEVSNREMAKNGVVGKYPESYKATIIKLKKDIVKQMTK